MCGASLLTPVALDSDGKHSIFQEINRDVGLTAFLEHPNTLSCGLFSHETSEMI